MPIVKRAVRSAASIIGVVVALSASVKPVTAQIPVEDVERWAHGTIAHNKSDYVAAIVQQDGKAFCKAYGTETVCLQSMRIVELIGGSKDGEPWSHRALKVLAGRNAPPPSRNDERRLIVAIPSANLREGFVVLHNMPATPENVAAIRRAARDYGRGTLTCMGGTTYVVSNGSDSTCKIKAGVSARCDDRHGNSAKVACATGCQDVRGGGECRIRDLPAASSH